MPRDVIREIPSLICAQCGKLHFGEPGSVHEQLLYRVMLLNATSKSFFCDPGCYETYRNQKYEQPTVYYLDQIERKPLFEMRYKWRQHVAELRKKLNLSP